MLYYLTYDSDLSKVACTAALDEGDPRSQAEAVDVIPGDGIAHQRVVWQFEAGEGAWRGEPLTFVVQCIHVERKLFKEVHIITLYQNLCHLYECNQADETRWHDEYERI